MYVCMNDPGNECVCKNDPGNECMCVKMIQGMSVCV